MAGGANFVDVAGGDDQVNYQTGEANTHYGGDGQDTLVANSGFSSLYFIVDTFDGSVEDGQLSQITGFESYDVTGGAEADIASFDQGNDKFKGLDGADTAFGNLGNDNLTGGHGDDSLRGDAGQDVLTGGGRNDLLFGGHGNDRISGDRGQDSVDGGAGRDRIKLYLGNDTVTGGAGADNFVFIDNETGAHTLTDFASGTDQLLYNALLLQFGPPSGPLNPSLLSIGVAVGLQA